MKRTTSCVLIAAACAAGCTTLGPMPATTGISAVPAGRPGVEAQAGLVPGYFLSDSTQASNEQGEPSGQLMALIEPDRWLGTRGLIVGLRRWGRSSDGAVEPFIGYRHRLDDDFAIALIGHGTKMDGRNNGASYQATRVGAEAAVDARIIPIASWLALHGQASFAATYLDAHGTYCASEDGFGKDCDEDGTSRMVDGAVSGVFAAATGSLALDVGRLSSGNFHSLRLALLGSAGVMPVIRNGIETGDANYVSLGLTLTLGLGQ